MKIAFFDVDKTILNGDTFFRFFLFLTRKFPSKIPLIIQVIYYFVVTRVFNVDRILVKRTVIKILNGLEPQEIDKLISEFFDMHIRSMLRENAVEKFSEHQANGYQVILCSASPELYLRPLAEFLKADLIATKFIQNENKRYSLGNHCYGEGKISYIEKFVQEKKIEIDYSKCFFYSDHHSDLPMMKKVGNPIAVNPNKKLYAYALKNNWPILNW